MTDDLYLSLTPDEQLRNLRRLKARIPDSVTLGALAVSMGKHSRRTYQNAISYRRTFNHRLTISKPSIRLMFEMEEL